MRQRRQKRDERIVRPVGRGGRREGAAGAAKAVATVVIPGGRAVLGEGRPCIRPGISPAPGFASALDSALDSALGRGACLIGQEALGASAAHEGQNQSPSGTARSGGRRHCVW